MQWIENSEGILELILGDGEILKEKRRHPPRKLRGFRRPGRPSKAELAQISPNPVEPQKTLYDTNAIAERISDALMAGVHFKLLGPEHGCPPQSVIARLRRENPDFSQKVQAAIETQALMRQDELEAKVIEIAEAALLRGDTKSRRLAVEAFRWLAEQNDPATYRLRRPGRPRKSLLQAALAVYRVKP